MRCTVAIIQARMSSTRFPGKMMKLISGRPLIWHVINRVGNAKLIDKLIIATTTNQEDDIIEDFCKKNDILFFRGNESDVLDRYYQSAKKYHADVIIRITADDPLIDPQVIDKAIKCYNNGKNRIDCVSTGIKSTYPEGIGLSVFSFNALEKAWKNAKLPSEREHVTPYILKHPEIFCVKNIECEKDLSHLRWTVDYEKDFRFVNAVYQKLYTPINNGIFFMKDILDLLQKDPEIMKINEGISRMEGYTKSLDDDKKIKLLKGDV